MVKAVVGRGRTVIEVETCTWHYGQVKASVALLTRCVCAFLEPTHPLTGVLHINHCLNTLYSHVTFVSGGLSQCWGSEPKLSRRIKFLVTFGKALPNLDLQNA